MDSRALLEAALDELGGALVEESTRTLRAACGPCATYRPTPVASNATVAALTALWGLLAGIISPRTTIAACSP